MNDKPSIDELIEIREHFGLQNTAAVEKDWYVVKALAAIVAIDTAPFQLIFGGGTALSRAYRVTERMSEDIDLRIVVAHKQPRSAFKRLREIVTQTLLQTGFKFDQKNPAQRRSMYEYEYTLFQLPYTSIVEGDVVLRPQVQIEISAWPMRRASVEQSVMSFVAEGFGRQAEVPAIACTAIIETAAEKFVALTRRAGAEFAGLRDSRDPTLVRHIYDLHLLAKYVDLAEMTLLVREIMLDDAETYGNRFPAYRDNPLAETVRAVERIRTDKQFSAGYAGFVHSMVYGEAPSFEAATVTLQDLANRLKKA